MSGKLIQKSDFWVTRWLGRMLGKYWRDHVWITIGSRICYPDRHGRIAAVFFMDQFRTIIAHERVHVKQYEKLGPLLWVIYLLLPVPIFFAWGRWRIEREAYLVNIRAGENIDLIVHKLWKMYLMPWPRRLMREWFEKMSIVDWVELGFRILMHAFAFSLGYWIGFGDRQNNRRKGL